MANRTSSGRQTPNLPQDGPDPSGRFFLHTLGRAALELVSESESQREILGPGKPLGLLTYLVCSPGRSASREHLMDLLWADLDIEAARHSVRQAIWFLRQRLGEHALETRDDRVILSAPVASDYAGFIEAIERSEFERASSLYHGEFLPSFAAPGGADFEQWSDQERLRLNRMFRRAGETVVRDWLAKGRIRKAKELAIRVRDAAPDDEQGWRLVLETLIAANDRVHAELEAHQLEVHLTDIGRLPEPATTSLLALARNTSPESAPAKRALATELVGREREFAMALRAWDAARKGMGCHLHVTGAAGLGKTRLLTDVHARLRAAGAQSVLIRANGGERDVQYACAADIAGQLATLPGAAAISPGAAASLVALNPSLSARYSAAADRSSDLEALRRRETSLLELLYAVGDEHPLALLLDDVHWSDQLSSQIVKAMAARVGSKRILVITSARPGPEDDRFSAEAARLVLNPLSASDTNALIVSLGRLPAEPWAEQLAERLHGVSRGNPLLILETLHLLMELGTLSLEEETWRCTDPGRLAGELATGGALARRIEELERGPKWLLLLLSTAGAPVQVATLGQAAGRENGPVQSDLQALEVRGLVRRDGPDWQPAHDEIAARVVESATPESLRAANAVLGRQLAADGRNDPGVLHRAGRHLAAAEEDRELGRVFRRRLLLQRRYGERRSQRSLATALLGERATPARVSRLLRSLPLYVRLGLITPLRVAALIAGLGALTVATAAILLRPAPLPPDARLILLRRLPGDSLSGIEVPLRRAGWESVSRLDVGRLDAPFPTLALHSDLTDLTPSPDGQTWAFSRTSQDSGDIDLFAVGTDQRERRLTATPGDDANPTWSPDGHSVAFTTTRWSVNRYSDLAVLDLSTRHVTRLTFDSGSGAPRWSPDGTRLAFSQVDRPDTSEDVEQRRFCWMMFDGSQRGCRAGAGWNLLGWYDATQLLITLSPPTHTLARLNVSTGELRLMGADLNGSAVASPDGRWITCFCVRSGTAGERWYVFPTDRPDLWRPIEFSAPNEVALHPRFIVDNGRVAYLDHLEIVAASETVPIHVRYRLRVRASDAGRLEVPLTAVSWESLDTSIARIDDTSGVLTPVRPGSVTVRVSAGGWRETRRQFTIATIEPESLFMEDWRRPLDSNWIRYGDPIPVIDTGPGGQRAFWNRGDGWFESGAYSRQTFDARRGLGVEAMWSTPVNGPRQQYVSLTLISQIDSSTLAGWDHRTGSAPFVAPACDFTFPSGDRRPKIPTTDIGGRQVVLPPWLLSGRWYRIRLQLLPDGRCGVALNGTPLGVSDLSSLPLGRTYRIVLHGNSLGNRMLVGPLEVWSGVRDDVDWRISDRRAESTGTSQKVSSP